ncbi:hypothetical protein G9A89_000005 [Geosiphon pyriformis]|nr:hypothetical protein G9A89_000005 [Geosiphon pyriformis]
MAWAPRPRENTEVLSCFREQEGCTYEESLRCEWQRCVLVPTEGNNCKKAYSPEPVRSPKLSHRWLCQYCGGGPRGNIGIQLYPMVPEYDKCHKIPVALRERQIKQDLAIVKTIPMSQFQDYLGVFSQACTSIGALYS